MPINTKTRFDFSKMARKHNDGLGRDDFYIIIRTLSHEWAIAAEKPNFNVIIIIIIIIRY